ncbi:hypothetical protein HPB50_006817 [Hyalomma asiaticum]|uniref:Uncharacterized protein n=1 Tax=Hyalomma asiaticum TaxID=266040 RepID=A0ACB7SLR1_HYAAI|nr:hypothetical protein HPB50_006817 [Hyalomma asiaticum]
MRPAHEPKDLTSSLINSNLASLNIRSPTGSNPFGSPGFGSSPGLGSSPAGDFSSAGLSPATPQWGFQNAQQVAASSIGMPARFAMPPQPMNRQQQQQQQINTSAFDNLLPRLSSGAPIGAPRPTLSQMAPPANNFGSFVNAPPTAQNSKPAFATPVKPLSKSEMDDLLS